MNIISPERAAQMEIDFETDAKRLDLLEWQRAIESNLHAISDYVTIGQLITWQPGTSGRHGYHNLDVQLVSSKSCTCQRWRLQGRCHHVAFVKQLEIDGTIPGKDTPVRAMDLQQKEDAA